MRYQEHDTQAEEMNHGEAGMIALEVQYISLIMITQQDAVHATINGSNDERSKLGIFRNNET